VLQRFERRLGGLVEGAFAKVFKGEVQPVEIARSLQRETDDKRTVIADGKVVVPNEFVVELGQHDFARLDAWRKPLTDELAAMVREHAAEAGYGFVGPVSVQLEEMGDLDTGVFRVRSGVSAGDLVEEARVVRTGNAATDLAAAGPPAGALPRRPRLVLTNGGKAMAGSPAARGEDEAYFLTHSVTVIGRAADADLRLDDPSVSRRHAEIRHEQGKFYVVDLGSTNGVRVDNGLVLRQELSNGDRIEIGSTSLVFQIDED
jgi:hypothetical protein